MDGNDEVVKNLQREHIQGYFFYKINNDVYVHVGGKQTRGWQPG